MPLDGDYAPSPSKRSRDQVELYERTGGAQGNTMRGMPIVIITTRGARTGKLRKIPLMRVEHDGRYAVVASMGGAPEHPTWYHNIVADSRVMLQDGPQPQDMLAHEAHGEEKLLWWERAVAAYPDYASYQLRTDRQIPVFVLEPVRAQQA